MSLPVVTPATAILVGSTVRSVMASQRGATKEEIKARMLQMELQIKSEQIKAFKELAGQVIAANRHEFDTKAKFITHVFDTTQQILLTSQSQLQEEKRTINARMFDPDLKDHDRALIISQRSEAQRNLNEIEKELKLLALQMTEQMQQAGVGAANVLTPFRRMT